MYTFVYELGGRKVLLVCTLYGIDVHVTVPPDPRVVVRLAPLQYAAEMTLALEELGPRDGPETAMSIRLRIAQQRGELDDLLRLVAYH